MKSPYLAASLSVEDLSRKLNIPARNLSQALHSGLNKNFYDFVNSYRIDEVKKRIQDAQYQKSYSVRYCARGRIQL